MAGAVSRQQTQPSKRPQILAVLVMILIAGYFGITNLGERPATYGALSRYVFVQSLAAPEITVVDTSNDTVAGTITLPVHPDQVVVAKDIDRIIYSNREAHTLSVYDLATQTIEATITLPFMPENIVLSPDGQLIAATNREAGKVAIVRLTDNTLRAVVEGFDRPGNVAFANDSGGVFVSESATGQIGVIDALSGFKLDPIKTSQGTAAEIDPQGTALSAVTRTPNGLYGLVGDRISGKLSVINFNNWLEINTLAVGAGASRPYGTADGRFMMIASNADRTVTILSTENFEVEATLAGLSDVTSIATGYFETLAYVVGSADKKAVIIDLEKMITVGEINFGGTPGPAIVDAEGKRMYVALTDTNELLVIDVFAKAIIKRISNVGNQPMGINLAATNNYCH